ncbi:MAG: GNAT family protein [Spirosomataceae bacterium]
MNLILIKENLADNDELLNHPRCREILQMSVDYYKKIGYAAPWVGYFVQLNGAIVGSAGFKGAPLNGTIEIAYGTFEEFQNRGIGAAICKQLVNLSQQTDPTIKITARTLENDGFSAKILLRNGFQLLGTVMDPEDGEVWEWVYQEI